MAHTVHPPFEKPTKRNKKKCQIIFRFKLEFMMFITNDADPQ